MKRFGFTLAEVLITLGIIGVISALTLPSLLNDTQGAQVGPKLGKAVSMLEQANQAVLDENNADSLSDAGLWQINAQNASGPYGEALSNHLKITPFRGTTYSIANDTGLSATFTRSGANGGTNTWSAKDGVLYTFNFTQRDPANAPPHRQRIGRVFIDINGEATPNLPGTDVFAFILMNDGSLTPVGAYAWNGNNADAQWRNNCQNDQTPTNSRYYTCTASIFENNMKVLYKMR